MQRNLTAILSVSVILVSAPVRLAAQTRVPWFTSGVGVLEREQELKRASKKGS